MARNGGYLFAAPDHRQLTSLITWDRPWYGPRDASLNVVESSWSSAYTFFDFPLEEGKSWPVTQGGPVVTAHRANISTPAGLAAGFAISGGTETNSYSYDYVPSVGFFVHFTRTIRGAELYRISLTSMSTSSHWTWFERMGGHAFVYWDAPPGTHPADTFDVPPGADVVSAIGYGTLGTRGVLNPPPNGGNPWTFDGRGCCDQRSAWIATQVPAVAGTWQLAVTGANGAYAGLESTAAKWIDS